MAGPGTREVGKLGKIKKARIGTLSDGMWGIPLSLFLQGKGVIAAGEGVDCKAEIEKADGAAAADVEGVQDPVMVFCDGVMTIIVGKLDVRSIARARVASSEWMPVASADKLWGPKCLELWNGKAHIPRISKERGLSEMEATSRSIMDGKRNRITRNDMCDHVWDFHLLRKLKFVTNLQAAPVYWRNLDPYWGATGAPMRRYFHPDGTITPGPDDKVWGGHESVFTVVTGLLADGKMREHYVRINRWPQMTVQRKPDCHESVVTGLLADGKMREHYVRINRWPQMTVQRKPDWSWVLSNHLYCYSSIPDADKVDGTGPFVPVF